jgi:predicted PurR-regulated permease PerM
MLGGTYVAWLKEAANPTAADIESLTQQGIDYIRPKLVSITGATGVAVVKLAIGTGIMIVAIFFFLYDGPGMVSTIMKLSPLDDRYEQELLLEFDRISRAVVLATIFSALAQGAVAGVGYYFAGLPSLVLLTLLTTVFALVPIFGPATVWVPVCLYLAIYEQNFWAAGLLAGWGVLVVGTIDNLVKAFVLHGQSQLHPLLALMSIIGGVQALGPIGIVVGPMVVAMLQTLLGILRRELTNLETAAAAPAEGGGETGVMSVLAGKIRKRGVVTNDESAGADTKTPSTESGDKNEPNPTSDAPIKPKIEE